MPTLLHPRTARRLSTRPRLVSGCDHANYGRGVDCTSRRARVIPRALVHDYLYVYGGAERTLREAHAIWPEAPIHTLFWVRERLPDSFTRMPIRTTWVDHLPARERFARAYALLQPLAFASIGTDATEVISFASFGAKAVAPAHGGHHLSYCFTPPRFLWGFARGTDVSERSAVIRGADAIVIRWLRHWDRRAAARVTHFMTQSQYIDDRLHQIYGRRAAAIVAPPVDVDRFATLTPHDGGYYFAVARFEAYKRLDLAILACRRLGVRLRIAGEGVDGHRLRRLAGGDPLIEFLGPIPDEIVAQQLAGCRALLFPGAEDFGITAVEAQAAGRPVIAYGVGGATETVVAGVTGAFFADATVESLAEVIAGHNPARYHPDDARANAARFAPQHFRTALARAVGDLGRRPP